MPKRPPANNGNPKPIQSNLLAKSQREKADDLIEEAAEQLGDLLWKCWLASNGPRTDKQTKSGSQPDSPGSS